MVTRLCLDSEITREACNVDADPSMSKEFKLWICGVPNCSSATHGIFSLK